MRILIADDEFVSRMKLRTLLNSRGECELAEDGTEALGKLIQAYQAGEPYDLATVDINMPGLNGHELVKEIRQWEKDHEAIAGAHEVKILMITATRTPRDVMKSFTDGAEWYLVKPVTPQNVDEAFEKIDFMMNCSRPAARAVSPTPEKSFSRKSVRPPSHSLELPEPASVNTDGLEASFLDEYLDSTRTKLQSLERDALTLEERNNIEEVENALMRTLHSLKGEAGMIGLLDVQHICHETETIIREKPGDVDNADLVLHVKDWIEEVARFVESPSTYEPRTSFSPGTTGPDQPPTPAIKLPDPAGIDTATLKAEFWDEYICSTREKLTRLDQLTASLRAGQDAPQLTEEIAATLNTIKGEGAMIGLMDIHNIFRKVEAMFIAQPTSPAAAELLADTREWLRNVTGSVAAKHQLQTL